MVAIWLKKQSTRKTDPESLGKLCSNASVDRITWRFCSNADSFRRVYSVVLILWFWQTPKWCCCCCWPITDHTSSTKSFKNKDSFRPLLEKEMATHSSVLAWKIPWTEESGRLQSIGSHRVGHDWSDLAHTYHTCVPQGEPASKWKLTLQNTGKSRK